MQVSGKILAVIIVMILAGCAYDNEEDLYGIVDCPDGISFTGDIVAIIDTNCALPGCHVSGTQQPAFETYEQIAANAIRIKSRTTSGTMPPAGSGKSLTQEEINKIACWVDAGAPNN